MRLHIITFVAFTAMVGWSLGVKAEMPDIQDNRGITPSLPTAVLSPLSKGDDEGATTDYVIAGWEEPGGWQFSMGPTRQPNFTVLRLTRRVAGGAFGLECRKQDGSLQMRFLLDDYKGTPGSIINTRLTVGSGGGPLGLLVEAPPAGKQYSGLVVTDSVAITDILYAATREVPGAEFRIEFEGHSFGMRLPEDRAIMQVSARICDGWRKIAQELQQEPKNESQQEPGGGT